MGFFDDLKHDAKKLWNESELKAHIDIGKINTKLEKEFPDLPKQYEDDYIQYGARKGLGKWFESSTYKNLSKKRKYEVCQDLMNTSGGGDDLTIMVAHQKIDNLKIDDYLTKEEIDKILNEDVKTKKCPYCYEEIKKDAIKCRYCMEMLND